MLQFNSLKAGEDYVKKYPLIVLVLLIATLTFIAGCTSPSNPSPSPSVATQKVSATATGTVTSTNTVAILDFSFQPSSLTIQRGTSVTWRNDGAVAHHVNSYTNDFISPNLNPGDTYTHTFDQPGTYPYLCPTHPAMTGSIIVQ
jgi:plastocyanin